MVDASPRKTPLHAWHVAHGGRVVEFGGWSMPVQYTTIVEEHNAVRRHVGLFDISHMGRLLFHGPDALAWLEHATTNHVAKLVPGQIQYSLMVDDDGGVLDDILVYRLPNSGFGLVCNASNRAKVVSQFERVRGERDATLTDTTLNTAMIAIQGPAALETLGRVVKAPLSALKYYYVAAAPLSGAEITASRTGYSGEDGFELVVPSELAEPTWNALLEAGRDLGAIPCGLGARDTLRFEAGMPLYGHELSETINPYAAGLGWAVKLKKGDFIGREALRVFKDHPGRARVGLELEGRRIARQGCVLSRDGAAVGQVTSGTFSPTLDKSLAMALVDPSVSLPGTSLSADVRGHAEPARVVPLPFYRRTIEAAKTA